jgi:hypothetical protein
MPVSSCDPRIESFKGKNTRRAQSIKHIQVRKQRESFPIGIRHMLAPKLTKSRGVTRIAVPIDGIPVLPKGAGLSRIPNSNFYTPLGRESLDHP